MPQYWLDPAQPINWNDPLNRGLVSRFIALPGPCGYGSGIWRDLCKRNNGTLVNGPTWQGAMGRPGGFGSVQVPVNGYVETSTATEAVRVSYACWVKWLIAGASDYPYVLGTVEQSSPTVSDRRFLFTATTIGFSIYDGATKTASYTSGSNNDIWWHLAGTADGSNIRLYVNGVLKDTVAAGDPYTAYTTPVMRLGNSSTASTAPAIIDDVCVAERVWSDAEVAALYNDSRAGSPNTLNWIRRSRGKAPAAGGGISLAADPGTYSLTGTDASLEHGRVITSASGSYEISGTAATLIKNHPLACAVGSYAVTGSASSLLAQKKIGLDAGSYVLSGTAATLSRGFTITAVSGSYAVSGTAAGLTAQHKLDGAIGSYVISGSAAALERGYPLSVNAGAYTLSGTSVGLLATHAITAALGSYSLSGASANLLAGRELIASSGSYGLTGETAGLVAERRISAASGGYSLAGASANLLLARIVAAATGSFTLSGQDADLRIARRVSAESGAFVLTGSNVTLTPSDVGFNPAWASRGHFLVDG
jgi:hypothetical protein